MASSVVQTVTTSASTITLTGVGRFVEIHVLADGGTITLCSDADGPAVSEADDMEVMAAVKGATYNKPCPRSGAISIIASESVSVSVRLVKT